MSRVAGRAVIIDIPDLGVKVLVSIGAIVSPDRPFLVPGQTVSRGRLLLEDFSRGWMRCYLGTTLR